MSHHFDTPTAREDPRINICDFYLFEGAPGSTVMALTVNPDAGVSAPSTFRDEGIYAFRFDLDGDAREELAFKVTFGAVRHTDGDEHRHVQDLEIRRTVGHAAQRGLEGEVIATGQTGRSEELPGGVKFFAGLSPDIFCGDAKALSAFRNALFEEGRFDPGAFLNRENFFANRNVTAIVLEVPTGMIGSGHIAAWATCSLHGHLPEVQVSRWGVPLLTNIFMPDQDMREACNRSMPSEDRTIFGGQIAAVVETLAGLAGSAAEPRRYAERLVARFCPSVLPYELGTSASYDFVGANGRALADDVMDVILTLAANTPLSDGVAPDRTRILSTFPYFGTPYGPAEQADIAPMHAPARK
jgi:hypothetical protein